MVVGAERYVVERLRAERENYHGAGIADVLLVRIFRPPSGGKTEAS